MTELDKKERLTKHRCRYDLNHHGIVGIIICFTFAIGLAFLAWGHYNQMEGGLHDWLMLLFAILMCIILLVGGLFAIRTYVINQRFLFFIIEDRVASTREVATRRHTYYNIKFNTCTEFTLPHNNYTWSEVNKASDYEIFDMTGAGDEFYVVVRKHPFKKGVWVPYMAYNKKFFEISEKSFEKRDGVWYVKGE